jgi:hypothetical protein
MTNFILVVASSWREMSNGKIVRTKKAIAFMTAIAQVSTQLANVLKSILVKVGKDRGLNKIQNFM